MRSCARTRSYVERRTAEGKSQREIRRCLKRYIARELYRTLTTTIAQGCGGRLTYIEASSDQVRRPRGASRHRASTNRGGHQAQPA